MKRTEPQGDHRRSGRALPGAFTYQASAADPVQASRTYWGGMGRGGEETHRTKLMGDNGCLWRHSAYNEGSVSH